MLAADGSGVCARTDGIRKTKVVGRRVEFPDERLFDEGMTLLNGEEGV